MSEVSDAPSWRPPRHPATTQQYRHDVFTYQGDEDFVRRASEFFSRGIALGEPGVLISSPRRLYRVSRDLGPAAQHVRFIDTSTDARNPAMVLSLLQQFLAETEGMRVRGLDDLHRHGIPDAFNAETELLELLLNTPLCDDWNMWLGCPYDTADLSPDELAAVIDCHPVHRVDMSNLAAAKFGSDLPPHPTDAQTFEVGPQDLSMVRALVGDAARMAGLSDERVDEFVYAVNEVVSNSIKHGDGQADLSLWGQDDQLVCEVHDQGRLMDVLAGRLRPSLTRPSGRGLWMVNQYCDLVQVRSPASGTCVRMFIKQ